MELKLDDFVNEWKVGAANVGCIEFLGGAGGDDIYHRYIFHKGGKFYFVEMWESKDKVFIKEIIPYGSTYFRSIVYTYRFFILSMISVASWVVWMLVY